MTAEQYSDIRMLAYFIWERNGKPEGRSLDHWLEAEYLVLTAPFTQKVESSSGTAGVS
jgi:hypothetical protein